MALYSQTYETPWSYEEEVRAAPPPVAQATRARGVTPLEWPVTVSRHVFDNVKLKAEWWEIWKSKSELIVDIDTTLLVGGKLDYTVQYTQGSPFRETAYIAVDDVVLVTESLAKGETKSGSIDLTGLIGKSVKITIKFESMIGFWSEVSFDVWVIMGFSEEPSNGEPPTDEWPIAKTELVFDNERISPGLAHEVSKKREKRVDTSLVLGGKIEYSVKLESSILTGCNFYVMWNNEILEKVEFWLWEPHGTIKAGTVDIPLSKIRSTNVLKIAMTHVPGTLNICFFSIFVTLGYSIEPPVDPPWEGDWWEWLMENAWWISLGIVGTGLILMYMPRPGPPVIIVQPSGSKGG